MASELNITRGLLKGVLIFLLTLSTAYAQNETLTVETGESVKITFKDAYKINVTRKGVIHLTQINDDLWQVTALRSGVVALEIKTTSRKSKTMYIQVIPRKTKNEAPKESAPSLSDCRPGSGHSLYKVTIALQSEEVLKSSSVNNSPAISASADISGTGHEFGAKAAIRLSPSNSESNRKMNGDPWVLAPPCEDVEIKSGGEDPYQTVDHQSIQVSGWRDHGIHVRFKLIPIKGKLLKIPYRAIIRSPSSSSGHYSVNEISSSVITTDEGVVDAGRVEMVSANDSKGGAGFLSDIPIIGPLMRTLFEANSASSMHIIITVSNISDQFN